MVAQTNANVNGKNKQKFVKSSSDNTYIAGLCDSLRKKGRERDMVTAEILEGSNDRAYEVLRQFGFDKFIPGTMYATASAVNEFFSKSGSFVYSCFANSGMNVRNFGDEYIVCQKEVFCRKLGIASDVVLPGPVGNKKGFNSVTISFMSAKLILAMCSLGSFYTWKSSNSMKAKLCRAIRTSAYGEDARTKMIAANEQKAAEARRLEEQARAAEEAERIIAEQKAAEDKAASEQVAEELAATQRQEESAEPEHQSASIPMSGDAFKFVVDTITQSVANVLKQQMEQNVQHNTEAAQPEKYLPSNWGYICQMIRQRQITIADAAKLFDMEYGDFYRIYAQYRYKGKENAEAPVLVSAVAS